MTDGESRMWHVTVTVAGDAHDPSEVRSGLERLVEERPFLLTVRYREDRAEVRYWEQAEEILDAASLALRLWNEHRGSAGLPRWEVIGLEVLDRDTFYMRVDEGTAPRPIADAGAVRPY
ncbi:hypothetical protein [Tenggerimyces flavus]|uniref:Uncharacterized protein n=1 Tax=Tenggerimyces flavus TaxID=1708749 RepID=A0ABV7YMY0_9ACTN|nr:hypothetical protein [Tenggerimyces flavus]MBM7789366.1 hypothetical protein [Tenggerimyces flavus]